MSSAGRPGDPGYSVEIERESLLLTVNELGIERADFVGWSGGGQALLEFGLTYPERVRSLTLIEPSSYWALKELGEAYAGIDELEAFLAGLAGKEVTEDELARFLVFAGLATDPSEVRRHPSWGTWVSHRMILSWLHFVTSHRRLQDLASIVCPVLLVKGTSTSPWEKRVVDILGVRLADARVVEPDGDHASHIESMDRFLDELENHLHREAATAN